MKKNGIPAPLLRTIESWLREEHDKLLKDGKSTKEEAARAGDDFLEKVRLDFKLETSSVTCLTRTIHVSSCVSLQNARAKEGKTEMPNGYAPGRFYTSDSR